MFIRRYSTTEDPQWVLHLQYRFPNEVVNKVRDGQLSDQEKTKHLGVLQYSRIRLPYDRLPLPTYFSTPDTTYDIYFFLVQIHRFYESVWTESLACCHA